MIDHTPGVDETERLAEMEARTARKFGIPAPSAEPAPAEEAGDGGECLDPRLGDTYRERTVQTMRERGWKPAPRERP